MLHPRHARLCSLLSALVALRAAPVIPESGARSLSTRIGDDTATGTITSYTISSVANETTTPVLLTPVDTEAIQAFSSPSPTTWALPANFSNMSPFNVTSYAAGQEDISILAGSPGLWINTSSASASSIASNQTAQAELFSDYTNPWEYSPNSLQILYPQGSINPGNEPQGGAEFYANPLDVFGAQNVSLEYSVYFPHDFEFVQGGKLPGLYGGHKGCSGGNAAEDCFSTRMMWRPDGLGELYLYVPKDKQSDSLCHTPPTSVCDSEYGLSIGRGAFTFAVGNWTTIRQDVWLNTPGQNNGGFNIWANGQLVMAATDVRYRENGSTCLQSEQADQPDQNAIDAAMLPANASITDTDNVTGPWMDEDWMPAEEAMSAPGDVTPATKSATSYTSTSSTMSTVVSTFYTPPIRTASNMPMASQTAIQTSTTVKPTAAVRRRYTNNFRPIRRQDQSPVILRAADDGTAETSITVVSSASSETSTTAFLSYPSGSSSDTTAATTSTILMSASSPSPTPFVAAASSQGPSKKGSPAVSPTECSVGFIGLFFSTFFGGHTDDWASPKDQYTYFKDFKLWINQ